MFFVYALRSLTRNYIYVGLTSDLVARLERHNKTTKPYRTFKLIYQEEFPDRLTARIKEKYLKSGKGKEFLKSISL